jgi:hypothetical protein
MVLKELSDRVQELSILPLLVAGLRDLLAVLLMTLQQIRQEEVHR